jgi:hypothetical protein
MYRTAHPTASDLRHKSEQMTEPFRLTMYEPPPERRQPYQIIEEGQDGPWKGISEADLMRWLAYREGRPEVNRIAIDHGEVLFVFRGRREYYLRRTPTAAEEKDRRAQLALF